MFLFMRATNNKAPAKTKRTDAIAPDPRFAAFARLLARRAARQTLEKAGALSHDSLKLPKDQKKDRS